MLERDHLYYFKSEKSSKFFLALYIISLEDKNFNLIILLDAHIRLLDFETLNKRNPKPFIPDYLNKQRPYILEIENETRKYVLAAKSLFDL